MVDEIPLDFDARIIRTVVAPPLLEDSVQQPGAIATADSNQDPYWIDIQANNERLSHLIGPVYL